MSILNSRLQGYSAQEYKGKLIVDGVEEFGEQITAFNGVMQEFYRGSVNGLKACRYLDLEALIEKLKEKRAKRDELEKKFADDGSEKSEKEYWYAKGIVSEMEHIYKELQLFNFKFA